MSSETIDRVIDEIAVAIPEIASTFRSVTRETDERNPSGERQLLADRRADDVLFDRLSSVAGVGSYVSEERSDPVDCGDGVTVAIDPLDGSSNLESNNPVGTIFGIYDAPPPPPASSIQAGGYVLFGPNTTMVRATTESVLGYHIDDDGRLHSTGTLSVPPEPAVYGFGGSRTDWSPQLRSVIDELDSTLKLRYGGSFVGDTNRVLHRGGVFGYPALTSRPSGKLRLLFEAIPIGFVFEQAGGRSSDGSGSIMEVTPTEIHQRSPIFVGSPEPIDRIEEALCELS